MDGGHEPRGHFKPVVLTGRRPPVERWLAIAFVALIVAVTKPWGSPEGPGGPTGVTAATEVRPGPDAATASPAPSSPPDAANRLVAAFCLDTRSWLVTFLERSHDQRIRVWQTIEPATVVSGPNDPAVPSVPVVADAVTELGWCAPVTGAEKPTSPVDVAVWRRTASGPSRIAVASSRPASEGSPFGNIYGPPGRGPTSLAASWSSGTYVFRYREGDGRERWFAVEVDTRPRPSPVP